MLVVVSPAKKLDTTPLEIATTEPIFSEDAAKLAKKAGTLSVKGLRDLMHISEDLAKLNKTRFASFGDQDRKAAIYSFAGDTYQGFEVATLNDDALRWAQDHMRILSGLYGVFVRWTRLNPIVWKWAASCISVGQNRFMPIGGIGLPQRSMNRPLRQAIGCW